MSKPYIQAIHPPHFEQIRITTRHLAVILLAIALVDSWLVYTWNIQRQLLAHEASAYQPNETISTQLHKRYLNSESAPEKDSPMPSVPLEKAVINKSNFLERYQVSLLAFRAEAKYKRIVKQLKLTAQDETKLYSILADRQKYHEDMVDLLNEKGIEINSKQGKAAFFKASKSVNDDIETEILKVLGTDRYAQFNDLESQVPIQSHLDIAEKRMQIEGCRLSTEGSSAIIEIIKNSNISPSELYTKALPPEIEQKIRLHLTDAQWNSFKSICDERQYYETASRSPSQTTTFRK